MRQALDANDEHRIAKCFKKLSDWEEVLKDKKAEKPLPKTKPRGPPKKWRPPPQQLFAQPHADPMSSEWKPLPLTWD